MGVAAQVVEDFLGRRERAFGVDHGRLAQERTRSAKARVRRAQQCGLEPQLFWRSLIDETKELAAKETERFDREEESPTSAIQRA